MKVMLVVVLGTIQDAGVPQVGCVCENCTQAASISKNQHMVASIAMYNPHTNESYIIDATKHLAEQIMLLRELKLKYYKNSNTPKLVSNKNYLGIDGIFLTHAHMGHYLGLCQLGTEAAATSQLPVYCTPKMARFLMTNYPFKSLSENSNIILHKLTPGVGVSPMDGIEVIARAVPHRHEFSDTVAYEIKGENKLMLYIPDVDELSNEVIDYISSVDVALIDGTFYDKTELRGRREFDDVKHPTISDTMVKLKPYSKNTEIYFTHLNHTNPVLNPTSNATKNIYDSGFGFVHLGQVFKL
jgi:pyrroloquinoline quinone biosynthesis protein B